MKPVDPIRETTGSPTYGCVPVGTEGEPTSPLLVEARRAVLAARAGLCLEMLQTVAAYVLDLWLDDHEGVPGWAEAVEPAVLAYAVEHHDPEGPDGRETRVEPYEVWRDRYVEARLSEVVDAERPAIPPLRPVPLADMVVVARHCGAIAMSARDVADAVPARTLIGLYRYLADSGMPVTGNEALIERVLEMWEAA